MSLQYCNTTNRNQQLLTGQWASQPSSTDPNKKLVFSFDDSTCRLFSPFGKSTRYRLTQNNIEIFEDNHYTPALTILSLTEDSLIAINNQHNEMQNTLRLARIKEKNNLHPTSIYFVSSGCYGSCPSMLMQVDSPGKIIFRGISGTHSIGIYKATITKTNWQLLVTLTRKLPLDSLQKKYEAGWTDDQACGIIITEGNKEYQTAAYGYDKEPVELRILFNHLMELPQKMTFEKDSTLTDAFFFSSREFSSIMQDVFPPPPPVGQYKNK